MARVACALGLVVQLATGCSCSEDPLAELESFHGTVERDHAEEVGSWQGAEPGAEFFLGDGLRTATGADAVLRVTGGSALNLEEDTTIRFLETAPGEESSRVSVEAGEVEVEAASDGIELATPLGVTVVDPGSRLRIEADEDRGTRIEVQVGRAELIADDGSQIIEAGHGVELEIGAAEIVPYDVGARDAAPPDEPSEPAVERTPPPTTEDDPGGVRAVVRGAAARIRRGGEADWERVAVGETEMTAGTTVEVAARGTVELNHGDDTAVLGPGQYVIGDANGGTLARADRGSVRVSAGSRDVVLEIPGGTVVTHAGGSRADVNVESDGTAVQAREGSVEVIGAGLEQTLEAGETITVPRDDETRDTSAAPAPRAYDRGPDYRDITAQAGESFTIRDPRPPTAIGLFLPASCGSGGVVELMAGSRVTSAIHGRASVNVLFPRGRTAYRVRCDDSDAVAADGTIRVVRDNGIRSLPRVPPTTVVDANGMTYNVLYQNRLPEIRARWADAPATSRLRIETGGRTRTVAVSRGRAVLRSGQLSEGTHRLVFEGGGRSSPPTTVRIRFDNAADVASVQAPRERGFRMGQPVEVSGTALPGWHVRVAGTELPLDAAGRFSGNVPTSAGQRAIGIRVTAPGRGENVYIRHGSGH